jgi:hypothetical protein
MHRTRRRRHLGLLVVLVLLATAVVVRPAGAIPSTPPNDDYANAQDLGSAATVSVAGGNRWATAEPGEPDAVADPPVASVWYRWTAPRTAVVSVDTCGSDFDTSLGVFDGASLGTSGRVAGNDESCGHRSALRFIAVGGTTYHVEVDGFEGAQGSIRLRLRVLDPPANDDFASATDLGRASRVSVSGTTRDATVEWDEPDHLGSRTIASAWFRWTAPASHRFRIDTCGSRFDTVLVVYTGAAIGSLHRIAANDDDCRTQSRIWFRAVAGTTYDIVVAGYNRKQGAFRLGIEKLRAGRQRPRGA